MGRQVFMAPQLKGYVANTNTIHLLKIEPDHFQGRGVWPHDRVQEQGCTREWVQTVTSEEQVSSATTALLSIT